MATETTRDWIWNHALKATEPFYAEDLVERVPQDVSRKTVRDCLNTMVQFDVIERDRIEEGGKVRYTSPDVITETVLTG